MRTVFLVMILGMLSVPAWALAQPKKPDPGAVPTILYPVPLIAKPGTKSKLVLRGRNLDTVKEVVASDPSVKVKFLAAKKQNVGNNRPADREGTSEVELEVELPKDVKPGLTLIAKGPAGESAPYSLPLPIELPRIAEKEDNDGFRQAQPITLPVAVDGTIRSDKDVDVFRFEGKKGQTVRIALHAARYGSPVDGFLSVHDADARVVATADDGPTNSDPMLNLTLPRDGVYFVSVIDVHDLGGGHFGYELELRSGK